MTLTQFTKFGICVTSMLLVSVAHAAASGEAKITFCSTNSPVYLSCKNSKDISGPYVSLIWNCVFEKGATQVEWILEEQPLLLAQAYALNKGKNASYSHEEEYCSTNESVFRKADDSGNGVNGLECRFTPPQQGEHN